MPLVNLRQNPIDSSTSPFAITAEEHTVAEFDELPGLYGFILEERPVAGSVIITTDDTAADIFTVVTADPLPGQVFVDVNQNRGYCIFNVSADGQAVLVDYSGLGANMSVESVYALAQADVLNTALTGFAPSTGDDTPILAADTVLTAFEKTQAQIDALPASIPSTKYAKISDTKTSGTAAAVMGAASWVTRELNTEDSDVDGIVTISANQFSLITGTYIIRAESPVYRPDRHVTRLRNITDSADTLIGTAEYANSIDNGAVTRSVISGRFTIASAKTFEIQHYLETAANAGVATNSGADEIYATVELWKVA